MIEQTFKYYSAYFILLIFQLWSNQRVGLFKGSFRYWFAFIDLFQNTFIWSFSFDRTIVRVSTYFFHWSDQFLFIVILVLRCDGKFSVGWIQTGHMNFLPLRSWKRLSWGCQLCVHAFWHQFIVLICLNISEVKQTRLPLLVVYLYF